MEPKSKKRKLQSGPPDNRKPGKRAKTSAKPNAKKTKQPKSTAGFKKLDAASLPWQADPEGMMGLEMIDGVDIVRDGDNVEFFVPEGMADGAGLEEDEEEFEGFDDLPEVESEGESDGGAPVDASVADKEEEEVDKEEGDSGEESNEVDETAKDKDTPADDAPMADVSAWEPLGISPALLSAIARLNFLKPTSIQSSAIPEVLAGHDVIGKASTGSGKTLAFAVPIIERWLQARAEQTDADADADASSGEKIPTALILSPTRELAKQLTEHIKALCAGLPIYPYVCSVTGGLSVLKQQRQLAKADIVIATPGRLWEVINQDIPLLQAFKEIKFLVVDEADRLLSEGHFKEAEDILSALDRDEIGMDAEADEEDSDEDLSPRQTLVFSATFNKALQQKLAGKGKFNLMSQEQSMEYLLKKLRFREEKPKFIDVNPVSQMAERLKEGMVECGAMEKVSTTSHFTSHTLLTPPRTSSSTRS